MKKIMSVLIAILLLGGCAVMEEKEPLTDEEVKQEMLEYAEKKYDKDFEVSGEFMHVNNSKTSPFVVDLKTEGSVGRYDVFTVKRTRKGSKVTYEDNYSNIYYRELAYEEIDPIVKKYFKDSYVLITLSNDVQEETNMTLTYSKAFNKGDADFPFVTILVKDEVYSQEELQSSFDKLYKELFSKYESGLVRVYTLVDDDESKIGSYENFYEYVHNDYFDKLDIESVDTIKRRKVSIFWLDGEVVENE